MKENKVNNNDNQRGIVKRLKLGKETVRMLSNVELKKVIGGTGGPQPTMGTNGGSRVGSCNGECN